MDFITKDAFEKFRVLNPKLLAQATIRKYISEDKEGWCLCFGKEKSAPLYVLRSARQDVRIFKTIDAANKTAKQFNFARVTIISMPALNQLNLNFE